MFTFTAIVFSKSSKANAVKKARAGRGSSGHNSLPNPANSRLSKIPARSLVSKFAQSQGEIVDSLWRIFEIFPFLRDAVRRPGAIVTAWCGRQSYLTFSEDTAAEVFDQQRRLMSAFGGEADVPSTSRYVAE
jgi:hypothetical protein